MNKKIRVAVLYGGKSGEHEVSLQSGASVIRHLDRERFEVIPVSIDKTGKWQWNDVKLIESADSSSLPIFKDAPEMRLIAQTNGKAALETAKGDHGFAEIDVFFPVMHGPLCEDGTIQGLLELANVAYVGSGVLGSALNMDKDVAKRLAMAAGLPVAPFVAMRKEEMKNEQKILSLLTQVKSNLSLPVFVKPANMGSSVGVHKVKDWSQLIPCLKDAFQYDLKVLVEQGIDAREIEVAVLEENPLFTSIPSEISAGGKHEFYSYEAKYLDKDGATVELPAKITEKQKEEVQALAAKAFTLLECNGFARVDFFLDRKSEKFYFNEINTIPGFTSISMYPKMMEASGVTYPKLLTKLIELALERQKKKLELKRDFSAP
jgi:D-alanine-D-alanine ligase